MYPNIFITEGFLEHFDESTKALKEFSIYNVENDTELKQESLKRLRDLLLSSQISCCVTDSKIIKYFKREFGVYNNFKDFIFHRAIKENRLSRIQNVNEIKSCNYSYFLNEEENFCNVITAESGVITKGKNFLEQLFYLDQSFPNEDTNEQISQIEKAIHPCSSLIIIDKYLFQQNSNRPDKILNLISVIKKFIKTDLKKPFEIDIIIQNADNNILFESKFNQIKSAFGDREISLHIYAPKKINEESDRYFVTNYAVITVGHPLDRPSFISSNFYPSCNNVSAIKTSYRSWLNKIQLAKYLINETPKSYANTKAIWLSDNLKHQIFIK